jgi:hypothetical protein
MTKLTELAIEELAIELLKQQGLAYLHGSIIAFDGSLDRASSTLDLSGSFGFFWAKA